MARQFNLIPPICEQAEYHMFQREKVEVQLPELFHKIGGYCPALNTAMPHSPQDQLDLTHSLLHSLRSRCHDLVPSGLRHRLREV